MVRPSPEIEILIPMMDKVFKATATGVSGFSLKP